jgi:multimeric flavodoxin WrbA
VPAVLERRHRVSGRSGQITKGKIMTKPIVLGLTASLRTARSAAGARHLKGEIEALGDRSALDAYLAEQGSIHLAQFVAAGRKDKLPFDVIYRNLKKTGGLRGLSNSEVSLVAALWGARQKGADIDHIPLADHFPASGEARDVDTLKAALRRADAILLSTPVYFGDRGSLAQRFIDLIREDPSLRDDLEGKLFAGIAVGAKRNGGQETTLIYAMLDMLNVGLLAVGNDSDTTSQYGGTVHAGDIGTASKDTYGIDTSIGTGRRIGNVLQKLTGARDARLAGRPRMGFWLLQDKDDTAHRMIEELIGGLQDVAESRHQNLLESSIRPCIACDICPTHVDLDEQYRCIIQRRGDGLMEAHGALLWPDVIVPTMFSPIGRAGLRSVYQQFMERTRYLRRGDYVFTDRLVVPLVLTEVGANENLDVRMMTSFIRHHTVMSKPVIGYLHQGRLLNGDEVRSELARAARNGGRLAAGRLVSACLHLAATQYHPVGYVLASEKDKESSTMTARERMVEQRLAKQIADARARLASVDDLRIAQLP